MKNTKFKYSLKNKLLQPAYISFVRTAFQAVLQPVLLKFFHTFYKFTFVGKNIITALFAYNWFKLVAVAQTQFNNLLLQHQAVTSEVLVGLPQIFKVVKEHRAEPVSFCFGQPQFLLNVFCELILQLAAIILGKGV